MSDFNDLDHVLEKMKNGYVVTSKKGAIFRDISDPLSQVSKEVLNELHNLACVTDDIHEVELTYRVDPYKYLVNITAFNPQQMRDLKWHWLHEANEGCGFQLPDPIQYNGQAFFNFYMDQFGNYRAGNRTYATEKEAHECVNNDTIWAQPQSTYTFVKTVAIPI